ncbi:MAG: hypothetical protein GXZ15_01160 [Campylobacter sp.]|nr:hypothetical protein [Campylobacter sp.]
MNNFKNIIANTSLEILFFKFVFYLYLISLTFEAAPYNIALALFGLYFLTHILIKKKAYILKQNFLNTKELSIIFTLIIISMLLSNFLNPDMDKERWYRIVYIITRFALVFIALAYFYALGFFSKKEIIIVLFISFFISSFGGIIEVLNHPSMLSSGKNEGISGFLYGKRNSFGTIMGFASISSIVLFFFKDKKLCILFTLYFMFFLIFSLSRANWVGFIAATLIFLVLNFKKFNKKDTIFALIAIAVTLAFLALLLMNFETFQKRLELLLKGYSSYRTTLWEFAIAKIKLSPLFGYGMNAWEVWRTDKSTIVYGHLFTHNLELEILINIGFVGLILCTVFVLIIAKNLWKSHPEFIPILIYFLVLMQFDQNPFKAKSTMTYIVFLIFFAFSNKFISKTNKM